MVVLWATRRFLPQAVQEEHDESAPAARHPLSYFREPRTLLVGVVVLAAAFTEGAANDWLSVAIREGYDTEAWVGVLGFAAFVTAMTVGRVLGTRWLDTYGRVTVLWGAFALAGVGAPAGDPWARRSAWSPPSSAPCWASAPRWGSRWA